MEAALTVAYMAAGGRCFLLLTPVVNDQPLAWPPLLLPFVDGVETNRAGYLQSLQYGLLLLGHLLLLGVLVRRGQRSWAAALLMYGAVGAAGVGQFLPFWPRWLVLCAGAALIWRRRHGAGALVLCAGLLAEVCLVAALIWAYGLHVAGAHPAAMVATLAGAAMLARVSWRGGALAALLPGLVLATLGLGEAAFGPAIGRHHDDPPAAARCQGLQVASLVPLARATGRPAWAVQQLGEAMIVGGVDYMARLSPAVKVDRWLDLQGVERIQDLAAAPGGHEVLAAGSPAVVSWAPESDQAPRFLMRHDDGARRLVEFGFVAGAGEQVFAAGLLYPLLHRIPAGAALYLGELEAHAFVGVGHTGGGATLHVWDVGGVGTLDPRSGRVLAYRRYGLTDMAVSVSFGRNRLYRARAYTRGVDVVRADTLAIERRISTPFAPRFLAASPDDRLLAASDMLGEHTHIYDVITGRQLARYRVGPRPRGVGYWTTPDRFVGVSGCGFYILPAVKKPR